MSADPNLSPDQANPTPESESAASNGPYTMDPLEAFALAVGSQSGRTPLQLRRLQSYAVEIGKYRRLSAQDLKALKSAAIMRDVGELAVPAHIFGHLDSLTPQEFEKLKAHCIAGAEILAHAGFPLAATCAVRAHHERWDGTGYPDGLAERDIPEAARLLAVADCMATLDGAEALRALHSGSGSVFDPEMVQLVTDHFEEIVRTASTLQWQAPEPEFPAAITAARREERILAELSREIGSSLRFSETVTTLDGKLKALIGQDSLALYLPGDDQLQPAYVSGLESPTLSAHTIPFGRGTIGRLAATRKPVLNAYPEAEAVAHSDSAVPGDFHSVLGVALELGYELAGVLVLFHRQPGAFTIDDLRVLLTIRGQLAVAVGNSISHERAERSTTLDPCTGLPNARTLFLRLDAELARCRRNKTPLTILVCQVAGLEEVRGRRGQQLYERVNRAIATALSLSGRSEDFLARMGDAFVLVLSGFSARDLAGKEARIEALIAEVCDWELGGAMQGAEFGAACYPEDGFHAEDLLAAADLRLNLVRRNEVAGMRREAADLFQFDSALYLSGRLAERAIPPRHTDPREFR
jgi:diguanylate cyclase (GGDEF)-like protein